MNLLLEAVYKTNDWIGNQEEVKLYNSEPGYQGWLQLYSNIACFHPGYKKIGFEIMLSFFFPFLPPAFYSGFH